MPRYEYHCSECAGNTDLFVSVLDAEKKQDCDLCGAKKSLTRVEMAGDCSLKPNGQFKFGYVMGDGQRLAAKDTKAPKSVRLKGKK